MIYKKAIASIFILGLAFTCLAATNSPKFPIKISESDRYFVDQNNAPFFYNAETAWRLFTNLSKEDAVELMKVRKDQGFNVIQVSMLDNPDETLNNFYGDEPFSTYTDLSTSQDPYFDHAKWVIEEAEKMGLVIAITAVWKGCCGGDWAAALTENGPEKAKIFGEYLGKKFKDNANVMWIIGGDNDPGEHLDQYRELARGIERQAPDQLLTYHAASSHSSSDVLPYSSQGWLDWSMTYTYYAEKDVWLTILNRGEMLEVYEVNHIEHFKRPIRPFLLGESQYEGDGAPQNPDGLDFPAVVRRQAYWSSISGACGHAYGSWNWKVTPEWRQVKDMPGAVQMGYYRQFFEARKWYDMIPDIEGTTVTSGAGEYGKTSYITAASTKDGLSTIIYIPPTNQEARSFEVSTEQLPDKLNTRWYDPTNGTYTKAKLTEVGGRSALTFTTPGKNSAGSNDWLLVLEAPEAYYLAPKAPKRPKIDGKIEDSWEGATWAPIYYEWLPNAPAQSSDDFQGRFKALWTDDKLYVLVEITDDKWVDDIEDPLEEYWEDDLLEVFIDEDNSGGDHQKNHSAFAYHIAAKDARVVDWGTEGKPLFFDDHLDIKIAKEGGRYTWEMAIDIYDQSFEYGQKDNAKVELTADKMMGFSIAFCDDDGNGRDNFIGTIPNALDSWMDASLFGKIQLVEEN